MDNRHPTEKESENPTYSHTSISLGKVEKKILNHLNTIKERFNVKGFSKTTGIPRSTITDAINRLLVKNMILKEGYGMYKITSSGTGALEIIGGVGSVRAECRERDTLSQHFTRFSLPITSKSNFSENRITELAPLKQKSLKLPNNIHHYAYFEDATIIIFKKQVIIRIHDIQGINTEDTMIEAFSKAINYAERLGVIGIKTESMELDMGHYARVQSALAEFLKKIDDRYYLDLGNNKKFWIDFSTGKVEDETNDDEVRKRIDEFLTDVTKSDSFISDVDKLKVVSGNLVKLAAMKEMNNPMNFQKYDLVIPKEQQKLPSYIG